MTAPTQEEVTSILNALRGQLRDATTGLYAEPKWARSIQVQISILEEWLSPPLRALDFDAPVPASSRVTA